MTNSGKLTPDQKSALHHIASRQEWALIAIDRSGRSKQLTAARQQLAARAALDASIENGKQ